MVSILQHSDRTRRRFGLGLYILGMLVGSVMLLAFFLIPPLFSENPLEQYFWMFMGAVVALPAGMVYLTLPRLLDRYDPEPFYALMGVLLWGAIAACGFSATINTSFSTFVNSTMGGAAAMIAGPVISAPLVEEFWKGIAVFGCFYFLRREFDGVVDGIIYATFTAIGFAMVENVLYYGRAGADPHAGSLAFTVILRGVLSPWCHPLFTSMTGLGFGLARETTSGFVRFFAPILGYFAAVLLHAMWNGSAVLSDLARAPLVFFLLPLWFLFVAAFGVIMLVLVLRRGRIIRQYLQDEVALGALSPAELQMVGSPFGRLKARVRYGRPGEDFVRAAARLGLSKWHVSRALKSQTHTVSMDFIVPLRQHLAQLRAQLRR